MDPDSGTVAQTTNLIGDNIYPVINVAVIAPGHDTHSRGQALAATAAAAPVAVSKVPVDMNSIELSFATDTSNQLPEVIRQQRGVLALVDKSDPTIARYVFDPPHWAFHAGIVDISDKVRFAMYAPERWAAVNALAAEHGLQLDQFEVSALFETGYTSCLRDAISLRATGDRRGAGARVTAARLAFSAVSPCGVNVLEVSFAGSR